MYIEKTVSIGDVTLEERGFGREVFLEGFLLERLHHICPPGTEPTNLEPLNQLQAPGGAQSGGDGRVDIAFELRVDDGTAWAAVEIKADRLTVAHLNQLLAYLAAAPALSSLVSARIGGTVQPTSWFGVLVGPSIEPDLALALVKGTWSSLPGVTFADGALREVGAVVIKRYRDPQTRAVYVLTDKYFSTRETPGQRDYSRFSFDGGEAWFGAAALVRAFIAKYVETYPTLSVAALQQVFPKVLQGSLEVVAAPFAVSDARRYSREVFHIGLEEFVVCTQWGYAHGKGNLANFLGAAKRLGVVVHLRTPDGITRIL